jgi:hypothetical protein
MKFKIYYPENDTTLSFRSNDWVSFESEMQSIDVGDYSADYLYFVDDKKVTFADAMSAVQQARIDFETKRNATKKKVWVHKGATALPNAFFPIWVNK